MSAVQTQLLPALNLSDDVRTHHLEVVNDRRHLHTIPEIGLEEFETAKFIDSRLDALGLPHERCSPTGIVSVLDSGQPGPTVLLRADIDALPILEETGVEYGSTHPGKMHACGHDTHTAMQLGVARRLKQEGIGRGRIKLCFQPGEEGHHGAEKMIAAGVLDNPKVDYAYGQHIWSKDPVGKILIQGGPVMAAVDKVELTIRGRGTHAAYPHGGVDPVFCGAQIVTALQSIVSRNTDPLESAVVTISMFQAGTAHNIIPETAELTMSVRVFKDDIHDMLEKRIKEICTGVASALGCTAELNYIREHAPVINDDRIASIVREEAVAIVGKDNIMDDQRTMGAEDFGDFLRAVPGAFAFVGAMNEAKQCAYPHHHPKFNVDEDAFAIGTELMYRVAQRLLEL
jgi:amidohydrolase